eukprot:3538113-Amphidinium_carterae.2
MPGMAKRPQWRPTASAGGSCPLVVAELLPLAYIGPLHLVLDVVELLLRNGQHTLGHCAGRDCLLRVPAPASLALDAPQEGAVSPSRVLGHLPRVKTRLLLSLVLQHLRERWWRCKPLGQILRLEDGLGERKCVHHAQVLTQLVQLSDPLWTASGPHCQSRSPLSHCKELHQDVPHEFLPSPDDARLPLLVVHCVGLIERTLYVRWWAMHSGRLTAKKKLRSYGFALCSSFEPTLLWHRTRESGTACKLHARCDIPHTKDTGTCMACSQVPDKATMSSWSRNEST